MLSLVATPIGNLEDLSLRAARAILDTDILLAEDTRSARKVLARAREIISLSHRDLHSTKIEGTSPSLSEQDPPTQLGRKGHPRIVSYYSPVEYDKLPQIIDWLKDGLDVALISEAGMPVISDPGQLLVHTARRHEIPVTVIPGPSSIDTALVISGVGFDQYHFVGYLPKREGELTAQIHTLHEIHQISTKKVDMAFVAFESPERVNKTLGLLYSLYPGIMVVLCREMTKIHEEVIFQPDAGGSYRGEIVLVFRFPA